MCAFEDRCALDSEACVCVYCEWDMAAFAWFGAKHTVHSNTVGFFLSYKVLFMTHLVKIVNENVSEIYLNNVCKDEQK